MVQNCAKHHIFTWKHQNWWGLKCVSVFPYKTVLLMDLRSIYMTFTKDYLLLCCFEYLIRVEVGFVKVRSLKFWTEKLCKIFGLRKLPTVWANKNSQHGNSSVSRVWFWNKNCLCLCFSLMLKHKMKKWCWNWSKK